MSQIRPNGEIDGGQTEPAATGKGAPGLRFKSYQGDPVARLVLDRLRLTPFKFTLVMLGVTAVLYGLAALIYGLAAASYARFYPGDALADFLNWSVRNWAQMASFAIPPILLGLYLRLSVVPGHLFDGLVRDEIVEASKARLQELVLDGKRSFREAYNRRIWGVISLAVSAALVVAILRQGDFGQSPNEGPGSILVLFESLMMPLRALLFYAGGMMVVKIVVTVRSLGRLFGATTLNLRPFDPDGCGGLGRLYDFNMVVNYVIAAGGLGVSLQAYLAFVEKGAWIPGNDSPLVILLALYIVIAPYSFFATLGTAHRAMQATKEGFLRSISEQFQNVYAEAQELLASKRTGLGDSLDRIEQLRAFHRLTRSFPVWPYDLRSIRRFATVILAPLVSIAVAAAIENLVRVING